jgi:hypothetical protein
MALRTMACRPIVTWSIRTLPVTSAHECTVTQGESTDASTRAPDTTAPLDTNELMAWPTRPSWFSTNFAGGSGSCEV